jgi:hypothetical protein
MWCLQEYSLLHHAFPIGLRWPEPPHSDSCDMRNSLESLGILLLRCGRASGIAPLEYNEALSTWDCHDLAELQRVVASNKLTWRQATTNRNTYACFLANMLNITLVWEPPPAALPEGGHLVHPQYPISPASLRTASSPYHSWSRPSSEISVS